MAARPGYPAAAVDLLGVGPGVDVLDLAAGTGKLTVDLVARGAHVVAVEPIPEMRARLEGVEALDGTAEAIPLDDASVDVVTVAQAFHWFDAPAALAECRRVLRPGGLLAMLWNTRDETVDWVRKLGQIKDEADGGAPYDHHQHVDWEAVVAADGGFTDHVVDWFPNWQEASVDVVVGRTASTSWISALPDARREAVLDRVRHLLATDPATRGRASFWFPHDTVVRRWRARR
ncbi:MAG TPA: class I SAM-dependent methyltransferase [Acidimicrobiales bacterium]|nr:class I SAM-dependent methyltransferase [Acidimicrobiales bacterium]